MNTTKTRTVRRPGPAFEEVARRAAGSLTTSILASRRHDSSTAATSAAAHFDVIRKQASQLARIQETLQIVVKYIDPKLAESTPAAMQIAQAGSSPDLATTVVVSDPIGTGYVLSQADIAKALGISSGRVSVLVRALGVAEDGKCAVQVRKGKRRELVNYHPRAIERMRQLIKTTAPDSLNVKDRSALRRAKLELAL